jgi:DNA-directed RNA polymerase subunit RPC12/RpoP
MSFVVSNFLDAVGEDGRQCLWELMRELEAGSYIRVTDWWKLHGLLNAPVSEVKKAYPEGKCPDCGEEIDPWAEEGATCRNCGHALYSAREDDDG